MLGLVVLAATEARLGSAGGWIACSPWSLGEGQAHRLFARRAGLNGRAGGVAEAELGGPAARSEALKVLVFLTERWEWMCLLPWAAWVWEGAGIVLPQLGGHWGIGAWAGC